MRVVAFVPIKMHSRRLENKMLLPLGGRPLWRHIFECLTKVQTEVDMDIYCYCSDDSIQEQLPDNVRFLQRSKSLDSDVTKGMEIYTAFAAAVPSDVYVLCHATSPFVRPESIASGIKCVAEGTNDSAFSGSRIQTFCWFDGSPLNYSLDDIVQTQNITPVYFETSAFFVFTNEVLKTKRRIGCNPHIIETNRVESIDIDELDDYLLAQCIANSADHS